MKQRLKNIAIDLRNRFHPSNRLRVDRRSRWTCNGALVGVSGQVAGADNTIEIGSGVRLRRLSIQIKGNGNRLIIAKGCRLTGSIEMFGDGNTITIGEKTTINEAAILAHWGTQVDIGANCLFSMGIDIRTTDSHSILDASGKRINPDKDVKIGDRVWLGLNAAILKGAVIENDVVIGSRSVVTGRIPANSVAAGMPAKVIRSGTTWAVERL